MRIGVALINLGKDRDRLAHMAQQFAQAGIAFERFEAVYGLAVPDSLRPWFFDLAGQPTPHLKPGEIGVYASHLALHRQLLHRPEFDALVVFEDDCEIAPDFADVLKALAASARNFDIVRLSNPTKAAYLDHGALVAGRHLVTYARVPNNMGCYLITRAGALKTTASPSLRRYAIDEDFRRPWEIGIETLGVLPPPARANIFETSSIDAMGDRALGREGFMTKLKRRHRPGPVALMRQWRWQCARLGFGGYVRAILLSGLWSVAKRLSPRAAERVASHFAMPGRP
ncbi:MAG: glycosyltransferase family 25 protein [Rhizobiales bacterium]|nr:glycosyltransferase family 25 protein [Hyphomicrobiales bacterium]